MLEDTYLPVNKASAIRGGMGEMLLRINCISDRNCDKCEFEDECIVRRVMYSKMKIQPAFMTSGDSVGYVVSCEDRNERYKAGDRLDFDMLLFGRMVAYFGQILQAIQYLGYFGLGKNSAHFKVVKLTNSRREDIMDGRNIDMSRLQLMRMADYVKYRKRRCEYINKIVFHTPLTLKIKGELQSQFDIQAIAEAIERRIYMLNCYEGIDAGRIGLEGHIPTQGSQNVKPVSVERYSSTHDSKIRLNGICGDIAIEKPDEEMLELLLAGELIHIGKNTSFGFGRYSLKEENR